MGKPMARNLLAAGHGLTVHNRSRGAVEELVAAGAREAFSPAEVASLHPVPLANLLGEHVPRWARTADGRPLLQMPLRHDMVIHAPTGAILLQFREVALRGRPLRVADLAQPEWTRR